MLFVIIFLLSCIRIDNVREIKNGYHPIVLNDGFGSSSRIKTKHNCYIVTANHVIGEEEDLLKISEGKEYLHKKYVNEDTDMYVIWTNNCDYAIEYREPRRLHVGQEVHYWCMPSATELKYYKGYISRINNDNIVIFGYTWFGCSGSGVFTKSNEFIGVISSMMATPNPSFTDFVAHENVISVSIFKKEYIE